MAEPGGQPGSPAASDEDAKRVRKPMYEDEHESCSVLVAKIRNDHLLLNYDSHDQFRWLHRFYLVLDRIAEQHRVYKLYGGPHGFMISTGVAETDEDHASTLLRFSLHVLQAIQQIRLPGLAPVDLCMVLASGRAASGLLGTTSLTYQIVGRPVAVARELMEGQRDLPFMVTSGMYQLLAEEVVAELAEAGQVDLACCPGEQETLYTLPRWRDLPITPPGAGLQLVAGLQQLAASGAPTTAASSGAAAGAAGAAGRQQAGSSSAAAASADAANATPEGSEAPAPASASQPEGQPNSGSPTVDQVGQESNPSLQSSGPGGQSGSEDSPSSGPGATKPAAAKEQRAAQSSKPPQPPASGKGGRTGTAAAAQVAGPAKKQGRSLSARLATQHWARGLMQPLDSTLPFNTQDTDDSWLSHCDLLLRFNNPAREAAFARFYSTAQAMPEMAWLMIGLLTVTLYYLAATARGTAVPLDLLLPFQALPMLGALMWRCSRETYLRWREPLWFAQRLLVLVLTSLPGSFVLASPSSAAFGFGLGSLTLEMLTRRLRLHLQLLSSLFVYVVGLSLMGLHEGGSPASALISPRYLSLHLAATCLTPVFLSALFDVSARRAFAARLKALDLWERPEALESVELLSEQDTALAAAAAAAVRTQPRVPPARPPTNAKGA
ncbi:adenylyl cyclase isoform A [Chlorella sorokiniana]|uniref:Adenylyl cyclase isoform A n=1 Tax=Chlorella sorokiniana TaxID=3076 RepID=A0A2P6TUG5_CHLSO|nr:adenylyl cyclase isoform A [Chlorella sorokiniana]|eukprot:PRW57717.1 adenylyl cyclase isoform A [Chlorella sorokiniana]